MTRRVSILMVPVSKVEAYWLVRDHRPYGVDTVVLLIGVASWQARVMASHCDGTVHHASCCDRPIGAASSSSLNMVGCCIVVLVITMSSPLSSMVSTGGIAMACQWTAE